MRKLIPFLLLFNLFLRQFSVFGQETTANPTDKQVGKLVLEAAKVFSLKHCKDFVSIVEFERFVKSGGKYSQAFLSYGLFGSLDFKQDKITNLFNDPAIGCYRVLGSFNSLFINPTGQEYIGPTYKTIQPYDESRLFSETFDQYPLIPPVARMRAVEVYGPLNPKKAGCYNYTLIKGSVQGYCEIAFETAKGAFPSSTLLNGRGIIFINKGVIMGFRLENVEERFSFFLHSDNLSPRTSVTDYDYEVRYTSVGGVIFPETIKQNVRWKTAGIRSLNHLFYAEVNPCLEPFKKNVSTYMKLSFRDHKFLDKQLKQKYSRYFTPSGATWRVTLADPTIDHIIQGMMNRDKLWRDVKIDLTVGGRSLEDQNALQTRLYLTSGASGGAATPSQSEIDRVFEVCSSRDRKSREIFTSLY